LLNPPHPRPPLFPYTTLFRSHAREAALASEAASLQGRFWEMHDLLYREQSVWSKAPDVRTLFNAYAGILGLNIDRFKKDMESEQDRKSTRLNSSHVSISYAVF